MNNTEQNTYPWNHDKRYNDYTNFSKKHFSQRVQKISINAGFTCPNRDGSKGTGGCTYCNNNTFSPFYCKPSKSITQQLDEGINFFAKKYKAQKYLAYFQSYTNTYAPIEKLKKLYTEALSHPDVIGLVIATRPDCVNEKILDYLQQLSQNNYIVIEYGIESTNNDTLKLVNRCHTFEDTVLAINMAAERNLHIGAHLILGLPNENHESIVNHAKILSKLPIETLKLHQLQIIKNTAIAKQFEESPEIFLKFTPQDYINLIIIFLENLNPKIIIERFISESPLDMLISPHWNGMKNFEIINKIEKQLEKRNTWQGKLYN
ncbi:MAG: TIGR01212 family radical SAM protein [Bacteroidetes bacterium]|nr:TIGR01212 family radical SAM protein [Bacteroidota bacterium]